MISLFQFLTDVHLGIRSYKRSNKCVVNTLYYGRFESSYQIINNYHEEFGNYISRYECSSIVDRTFIYNGDLRNETRCEGIIFCSLIDEFCEEHIEPILFLV